MSQRPRPALMFALIGAGLMLAGAAPALADNGKVPPGNPCGDGPGKGTGNPCGGNNGNSGAQGNAGGGRGTPGIDPIDLPPAGSRGVFITQIGESNRSVVSQGSSSSYAKTLQDGTGNTVSIEQGAAGLHYAATSQVGDANVASATQSGTGRTVLMLGQRGNGNTAAVLQHDDGASYSAAAIRQTGHGNNLSLVQDGSDNQARLDQTGNDNAMTAVQIEHGNRLAWTQDGHGLSDLGIVQTGGATLQVTQSATGAQFAPPPPGTGG